MSAANYRTLGLAPGATLAEIKKAYKKRALETHPNKGGTAEKFRLIQEAYERLTGAGAAAAGGGGENEHLAATRRAAEEEARQEAARRDAARQEAARRAALPKRTRVFGRSMPSAPFYEVPPAANLGPTGGYASLQFARKAWQGGQISYDRYKQIYEAFRSNPSAGTNAGAEPWYGGKRTMKRKHRRSLKNRKQTKRRK